MSFLGANGGGFGGGFGGGYGGAYGGGYGMNSMYGGGGMGLMQNQQQQQQPQIDPATGQPVQYQFDLRRDIQATIGGMNASLGLAYGLTQMLSLSAIGFKFAIKAAKYIVAKIFDLNNILGPIKLLLRILFGIKFDSPPKKPFLTHQTSAQQMKAMESFWDAQKPHKPWGFWPKRFLGMSGALLKSVILALVGIMIQGVLFLIKRGKARRLEQIKKKEEEEALERQKKMEEQWRLAEEQEVNQKPDFILPNTAIVEVSSENEEESKDEYANLFGEQKKKHAYDGELNAMTFNHVKSSDAFTKRAPMFDVSLMDQDEEFNKWLNQATESKKFKRSEDGWPKKKGHYWQKSRRQETVSHLNGTKSFNQPSSQLSFGPTNQQ